MFPYRIRKVGSTTETQVRETDTHTFIKFKFKTNNLQVNGKLCHVSRLFMQLPSVLFMKYEDSLPTEGSV
jgi:hypothetical protein